MGLPSERWEIPDKEVAQLGRGGNNRKTDGCSVLEVRELETDKLKPRELRKFSSFIKADTPGERMQ